MMRWIALFASVALASGDGRGWTEGTPAAEAATVIAGAAPVPITLPADAAKKITGPTVLFFFSPTCPHCRHVAAEIQALHERLAADGKGAVLGVVSASGTPEDLAEFQATFHTTFPMYVDASRGVQTAMGAKSTPSVMLVAPAKKGLEARDAWLPFHPGWSALVLGRVANNPFAAYTPGDYVGNNACATCHVVEHGSWLMSLHSVAWRSLALEGDDDDPACTRCHVTGAGSPTGWAPGRADLVDVGCEACHGPGGPHDGAAQDARGACAGCHDAEHSIGFDVAKGVSKIDHYLFAHTDAAAFDARRRDLFAGNVPQEMIALPQGKNVGSRACLGCHDAEHEWWSGDAHANAMASLRAKGSAEDPACLPCHATAKQSGPPPATVDGFDRLGGVGCESCHGPGERHVAAKGGADNIVGLGESCPVCVIDAVCTSCHTPKWSPDWDLEPALEKIRHSRR